MAPRLSNATLRNFIATTQGKSYTVGAVTVILILVIFVVGVFPALSSILFQIQQNGNRMDALQQIETKRQTLRALSAEEESKRSLTLSLNSNLPDTLDQKSIFNLINNMISSVGCQLVSVTFNELEAHRDFAAAFGAAGALDGKLMNITVKGDRTQMETLIAQLEDFRRVFNINNFSMFNEQNSDVSVATNANSFRLEMQVEVYFWNKAKTL